MANDLKKIRTAYYEAGRQQPSEYDPLPSWESLPIQLREAFIHVWHDGHSHGTREEQGRPRYIINRPRCQSWATVLRPESTINA